MKWKTRERIEMGKDLLIDFLMSASVCYVIVLVAVLLRCFLTWSGEAWITFEQPMIHRAVGIMAVLGGGIEYRRDHRITGNLTDALEMARICYGIFFASILLCWIATLSIEPFSHPWVHRGWFLFTLICIGVNYWLERDRVSSPPPTRELSDEEIKRNLEYWREKEEKRMQMRKLEEEAWDDFWRP